MLFLLLVVFASIAITGAFGLLLPWVVGYFHVFWLSPAAGLESAVRNGKVKELSWMTCLIFVHITTKKHESWLT